MEDNKYIKTGFTELDKLLNGGLKKGELVILASRPAVGKTSFAINILANAGIYDEAICAFFSIDTPKEELAQKMLCSISGVSLYKAQNGDLTIDNWKKLEEARNKVKKSKISLSYTETLSDDEVIDECRKVKREEGLDLVVIDYVQLMTSNDSEGKLSRNLQCKAIERRLIELAKELDIVIILLSQLSRAAEERTDHRPILSDLRDGGTLGNEAEKVMFIYNPDIYEIDNSLKQGICELIVAKNIEGETGTVKLKFEQECLKFENLDNE